MPTGASPQREEEYEEPKAELTESGRYRVREEEVVAPIVDERSENREPNPELAAQREGKPARRVLPILNYQHLTIAQIVDRLEALSEEDVRKIKTYEEHHKNRKALLEQLNRIVDKD